MRSTATAVEVFKQGERIASHPRSPLQGRHTTLEAHLAPAHQEVAGWSPARLLRWAATIGPHTEAAIAHLFQARTHPQQGYRAALGILRLAKAHGQERLEAACQRAGQIESISYRSIASLLKHGLERQPRTPAQASLPLDHAHGRGPTYYH